MRHPFAQKWILRERGCDGMNWIDLTQDRDLWHALVNNVMNPHVIQDPGKFFRK
jgi:hypothetical protein